VSELQLEHVVEELKRLSTREQEEVADYIAFLIMRREKSSVAVFGSIAEPAFARVWDNEDDAVYDEL
jgi:hypothetical protein